MTNPKVSIVLPFHGSAPFLLQAAESVLPGNADFCELILVNNLAERTPAVLAKELAAEYRNITLLDEPVQGISHALNRGIKEAKGIYVARMDADDFSLPGRFEKQADFLDENPDVGVVSGKVVFGKAHEKNLGMQEYVNSINELTTPDAIYNYRFFESPIVHPSVMIRKSLFINFGSYRHGNFPEDYELWMRWLSGGVRMAKIVDEILVWNDHPERLSRTHESYNKEAFDRVRLDYLSRFLISKIRGGKKILVWGGGKLSRKKTKTLVASGVPVEGFIDVNPQRVVANYPVFHFENLPPPDSIFIVSMVTNRGKNREINDYLLEKGYRPDIDFVISG